MGTLIVNQYLSVNQHLSGLDGDAATYIAAVQIADRQALESTTKKAINDFVIGCKSDGIWSAIKASCILAGARTLAGALTPLVGVAPTNFNFVAGDYNRKTGLVGDGSTKLLDTNRNNNADPQDDNHNAVYITEINTFVKVFIGAAEPFNEAGCNSLGVTSIGRLFVRHRSSDPYVSSSELSVGFAGVSRATAPNYSVRYNSVSGVVEQASGVTNNRNVCVFDRVTSGGAPSDGRISFYSIGESLSLALLDARVTQLMTDINNAF